MATRIEDVKHCLSVMAEQEVCEECELYGTTGTDHCEHDCVVEALNIIDKYQRIEQIVKDWHMPTSITTFRALEMISKVLEV